MENKSLGEEKRGRDREKLRGPIGGKNREKEFLVKKLRLKTKTHISNLSSSEGKKDPCTGKAFS
jgi:hypothetical protein